ncbi:hypothetical protein AX14_009103 [Amanita brunnescens Koide BX004]|nr:hypothetical protein AX14_009103 [Amanita brunnescens Koide BX004]
MVKFNTTAFLIIAQLALAVAGTPINKRGIDERDIVQLEPRAPVFQDAAHAIRAAVMQVETEKLRKYRKLGLIAPKAAAAAPKAVVIINHGDITESQEPYKRDLNNLGVNGAPNPPAKVY